MTIYFISGLGADERAFAKLTLPSAWKIQHVKWIAPKKKETLTDYCRRLSSQIDSKEEFVLAGLSFGGIVAIELARFVQPKKIILISSVCTRKELPLRYRIAGNLRLDRLIPSFGYTTVNSFTYWLFGTHTSEDKKLLKKIIKETSISFVRWSVHALLNWQNKIRLPDIVHIHGTADWLLPVGNSGVDYRIKGGGHMMVYNKADEMSEIFKKIAEDNPEKKTIQG